MKYAGYTFIAIGFIMLGIVLKGYTQNTSPASGISHFFGMLIVPILPILVGVSLIKRAKKD
jgi:lipopolysaccharide export LptBFGC system permease protein LptF